MQALIVGMNYMQDGERTISRLLYNPTADADFVAEVCHRLEQSMDEVWIVDTFDPNNKEFIEEIVKRGCRY